MNQSLRRRVVRTCGLVMLAVIGLAQMVGCEVDSFFDPSKALYGQNYPTTTPILERIDVIERGVEEQWDNATPVRAEDLLPSSLEYRLQPGDVVTVEIFELMQTGRFTAMTRRIDQSGNVRLPQPLRDVAAAGLTPRELEDSIIDFLDPQYIREPIVTVSIDQQQGFSYTVVGNIPRPGMYPLSRPDLRLDEALAQAGGAPITTKFIYVTRPVALTGEYDPFENRGDPAGRGQQQPPPPNGDGATNIDDLIDEIEGDDGDQDAQPGSLGQGQDVLIDIDYVQPRRVRETNTLDASSFRSRTTDAKQVERSTGRRSGASYVYVPGSDEWVHTGPQDEQEGNQSGQGADQGGTGDILDEMMGDQDAGDVVLERVIRVPYEQMLSDGSLNIVIRPDDRVFVSPPLTGVVYIGGEIARPGVYQLPVRGRLTLSQLVTAAGGFGPLAIPSRVDFTRRVGEDREATIRLNLGAIRQKTEPDIFLKPDDHIVIGTNWIAAPLAVIRNGFRATYGFGFLLDRNFGNDVFGAPPTDRGF